MQTYNLAKRGQAHGARNAKKEDLEKSGEIANPNHSQIKYGTKQTLTTLSVRGLKHARRWNEIEVWI